MQLDATIADIRARLASVESAPLGTDYRALPPIVLVKLGRPGTVKDVAGTALRPEARVYNVKFDVARQGALPVVGWNIPVKYLVAIP